jgi:dihydroflavonol-4-reductase
VTQVKRFGMFVPVTPGGTAVIDVRDVARMHVAAAECGRMGERYILTTANYTQKEWLGMVADVVGVRRPFLPVPGVVLPLAADGVDLLRKIGIQTPVDSHQVRLGAKYIYFDGSKAWKEFGQPQIDMRQSLHDTYAWYRERGYL